ncbi:protein of unknown function [Aminobacter niigataensis]|nr:protein of unknown function [Aminobacter niigataensis]
MRSSGLPRNKRKNGRTPGLPTRRPAAVLPQVLLPPACLRCSQTCHPNDPGPQRLRSFRSLGGFGSAGFGGLLPDAIGARNARGLNPAAARAAKVFQN